MLLWRMVVIDWCDSIEVRLLKGVAVGGRGYGDSMSVLHDGSGVEIILVHSLRVSEPQDL